MPAVSVIIPTYNRASFVAEAVRSVLAQTFSDFELLVVDDGSTDGTDGVLSKLSDRRLRHLKKEHGGVSSARNFGVRSTTTPLVAFLDSDDLWLPKKLGMQVRYFEEHPNVSICQTEEIWLRRGVRVNAARRHAKRSGWIFEHCIPRCIVSPSAVMMRREAFESLGGFDEELLACEDYDLWLRAALRYEIHTMPDELIVKRGGHEGQLSAAWGLDVHRIYALKKILRDELMNDVQRELVQRDIARRSRIISEGAAKRGKPLITE